MDVGEDIEYDLVNNKRYLTSELLNVKRSKQLYHNEQFFLNRYLFINIGLSEVYAVLLLEVVKISWSNLVRYV